MSTYPPSAQRAKKPHSPYDHAAPDWRDPGDLAAWLRTMQETIGDLAAAAEDQTRPPGKRDLGRRLARLTILEAREAIGRTIAAALRSVDASGDAP